MDSNVDVSVIIPAHNCEKWFSECLDSILEQTHQLKIEISVYFDCCVDSSEIIFNDYKNRFIENGYRIISSSGHSIGGVGFAKNKAVKQSCGKFLCFLDSDDVMKPRRIQEQYETACLHSNAIVGCRFCREPIDSTHRYTQWANHLTHKQLTVQTMTSHGPTVIMPTWFCSRNVFDRVGGFDESGKGTPEDLIFFYKHLDAGGDIFRVDSELLVYRYHPEAATFTINEETIWKLRLKRLESFIERWQHCTIWNAGKQGRKLYRDLSEAARNKVVAFCDVDVKKLNKGVYIYEESSAVPKPRVPIVHFTKAQKPYVICVKMNLTGGDFEQNLNSLNLEEGIDYVMFS